MLEVLTGAPVHADLAVAVRAATRGNPLFMRRAVIDHRLPSNGEGIDPRRATARLLRAATDSLSPGAQAAAYLLAIAGAPLDSAVLAAAMRDEPDGAGGALDAVSEGVAVGVFRVGDDGRLELTPSSLRDALLDDLDPQRLVGLHERLGEALSDTGTHALAAAPHLLAAADRDPLRAIDAAVVAAELTGRATMFHEAAAFLGAAVALADTHLGPSHRRTLSMLLDQAEHLRRAGDATHVELVWTVVRRADTADDREMYALGAAALCKLGPLSEAGNLNTVVAEVVERAVDGCDVPGVRAQCAGNATLFYSMSGRVDLCRSHFEVALRNARLSGDERILLGALGNAYISLTHPDDWSFRAELAAEMLALAERVDDDDSRFEALHLYFSTQIQFGDPLLRTTFARQEALATRLRSAGRLWMAGYQRACLAHLEGRLDDALAIGAEIFERAPVARSRSMTTYWMNVLVVRLAQGRGQELAAEIEAIIEQQPGLPGWRAVAAWLAALRGEHDRVRRECDLLSGGAALPRDMAWSGAAMLLGRAVAATGDLQRSRVLATTLAPYTGMMTWIGSCTVGPFDQALAELAVASGDDAAALEFAGSAQRLLHRLQASVYQADLDEVVSRLDARGQLAAHL